ncbi:helix-turn-helix domain-containing protein [Spartinivicinus poritis]|uniref:Helix-turn-helix domain-containing protein n=1 Tax=Spartinivicinus poritis TaxID=2994640 RepID=A0ABT5UGZ1_9GAMM|nr:helix-turn-helix domain-containing protein [Spartinivicinus sp. A2-2]MDE1465649.1 helix-turn-helix domain-containing protein [Spartinivicinus sp. A2-2]
MTYSLDFRQHVFKYKEKEGLTFEQTSEHFDIGLRTLFRWQNNLEPNKKIVLLALADNANDQGYCWPAMDTIAEKTSLSRSTVKRHIKSLAELDLLTKFERASASGATTSNHFYLHVGCQINIDNSFEAEENEGDQNDPPSNNGGVQNELPENIGGSPMNREGCTSDLGRGSPVTPRTIIRIIIYYNKHARGQKFRAGYFSKKIRNSNKTPR